MHGVAARVAESEGGRKVTRSKLVPATLLDPLLDGEQSTGTAE
jgi:hypothetical protein